MCQHLGIRRGGDDPGEEPFMRLLRMVCFADITHSLPAIVHHPFTRTVTSWSFFLNVNPFNGVMSTS